jgi:hypothetical protein
MSRRDEEAGLGCLLLIVIAIALGAGFFSCCSKEGEKRRDHEYRMEQLRLEHEKGKK